MVDRKPLSETHPHLNEYRLFSSYLEKESERGMVLMSLSFIDTQLHDTIKAFLVDGKESLKLLEGFNAPLGTLSSKASGAFALGLINASEFNDISILRKIRNEFAHSYQVNFSDNKIVDLCKNLQMKAHDYGDVVVSSSGQFSTSAHAVMMCLTNRPHYVSKKRLHCQDWQY